MSSDKPKPEADSKVIFGRRIFLNRFVIRCIAILAFIFFSFLTPGCGGGDSDPDDSSSAIEDTETGDTTPDDTGTYDEDEIPSGSTFDDTYDLSGATLIKLNGSSITVTGDGASVSGGIVTITSSGTYNISGTLNNGQVKVDIEDTTSDTGDVWLYLNGVNITCSAGAPVDIESAENVIIVLADDTYNFLTDGDSSSALDEDGENIDAALYSKEDLVIYGAGSLTIYGNYKDGIKSKDGLIINCGAVTVTSIDDGIIGKNYVSVEDGDIAINAGGDGLKSTNDGDTEQGYIYIYDGIFDITAGADAVQVETYIVIEDGEFILTTAGGSDNYDSLGSDDTAKGLKAPVGITINGGTFEIDSADDSIHSNDTVIINGGDFDLASGDDAIHADLMLTINDGAIDVSTCYEGIEAATITINNGDIHVLSDDDPINASDGSGTETQSGVSLNINGGYMFFQCENADGLDSNGSVVIKGGTIIINGPEGGANGILDYASFSMTGGFLIGAGTSSMAMPAGGASSQNSLMIYFSYQQAAGTLLHIESDDGATEIVTFEPTVRYQAVEISSSLLTIGTVYNIYLGGTYVEGTDNYGLGGTYNNDGTFYKSFTFNSTSTTVDSGGTGGGVPGQ